MAVGSTSLSWSALPLSRHFCSSWSSRLCCSAMVRGTELRPFSCAVALFCGTSWTAAWVFSCNLSRCTGPAASGALSRPR